MILINNFNDVLHYKERLEQQKQSLNFINPQFQNLNYSLIAVKANSLIIQQGEVGKNQYYILYGQFSALIKEQDITPSKQRGIKTIQNDSLIEQVISQLNNIQVLNKQYLISNADVTIANLFSGDIFGEAKCKRSYSVIADKDSLILELHYDEKYWRAFEIKHYFLEKTNITVEENFQLLSVCLKEQSFIFGDYIFKQQEKKKYIYMIIEGQVEFLHQNSSLYKLGQYQIFGFEEFLTGTIRKHSVRCCSASLKCYFIENLDYLNLQILEKLARERNRMISSIIRQRKIVFHNLETTLHREHQQNSFTTSITLSKRRKSSLYKEDLPSVGQSNIYNGVIKSEYYKTPFSLGESHLQTTIKTKQYSILEVNPEQYRKLVSSYQKRMRAERYVELHSCLKGQWDIISRISQSTPMKPRVSLPEKELKKQHHLKQNYTQLNQTFRDNLKQSPIQVHSEIYQKNNKIIQQQIFTNPFNIN